MRPEALRAYRALPVSRRHALVRLAAGAGVAASVLDLLRGAPPAFAQGEDADLGILYASLALEHHAIALYRRGLARKRFPAGLEPYAVEFLGDHEGHRDTQVAIARERGGRPPEALASYPFGRLEGANDLLRQAQKRPT